MKVSDAALVAADNILRKCDALGGTFNPAVSPITGGYALADASDATGFSIYRQIGPYTIYKGTGKKAGKYLVKGGGENSEMNTFSQAFDLVQYLLNKRR